MSQRFVETLIGRLITDEQFRAAFLADAAGTLAELADRGLDFTRTEIDALVHTDPALWVRAADALDPRLQKASLMTPASRQEPEHHV